MKDDAQQLLNKAFLLARRGTRELQGYALPFGLETVVMAHWRDSRLQMSNSNRILPALRWAAVVAVFFAIVSGAWKRDVITGIADRSEPEIRMLNSAFTSLDQ